MFYSNTFPQIIQSLWLPKGKMLSGFAIRHPGPRRVPLLVRNKIMCKLRKSFPNFMLFVSIIGFIKMLVLFYHNGLIFDVYLNAQDDKSKRSLHLHLDHCSVLDHAICTPSILLLTLSDNFLPFRCLQTHNFLFAVT